MENNTGLLLEILSPEGEVFKNTVREITLPTAQGEITVLPGHAPLFAKLGEGEIVIKAGGEVSFVCVTGGFLEVSAGRVNVLASFAIRSEEIEAKK
ncbi:MAG: ATP synthase F1 subunit epsilon, partial [Endomicrobiales bacterium]